MTRLIFWVALFGALQFALRALSLPGWLMVAVWAPLWWWAWRSRAGRGKNEAATRGGRRRWALALADIQLRQ